MNLQKKRKLVEEAKIELKTAEKQLKAKLKELKDEYDLDSEEEIVTMQSALEKKLKKLKRKKGKLEDQLEDLFEEIE